MIDRYKAFQEAKTASASGAQSWPQHSSTSQRIAAPSSSSSSAEKKRIAHVPNVMGLLTSKPKNTPAVTAPGLSVSSALPTGQQQPTAQQKAVGGNAFRRPVPNKTATPTASTVPAVKAPPPKLPRPMIAIELGCRVPANIRQKYLNILVDETLKIYDREEDAYERAVEEEKQSYAKCSSRIVYANVITNVVQRIRKEAENSNNPTSANHSISNDFFLLKLTMSFTVFNVLFVVQTKRRRCLTQLCWPEKEEPLCLGVLRNQSLLGSTRIC